MKLSGIDVLEYLKADEAKSRYIDKTYAGTEEDYKKELLSSSTVYVGNLSRRTKEEQLYLLFSQSGKLRRVIMGLDAKTTSPCGFCFVEFTDGSTPIHARQMLARYMLDGKHIYIDLDSGFAENRQYGRGVGGGQAREDFVKKRRRFLPM
ncbi:nuclear cap-binding protein subunit 2 [Nematocida sp. AWRm77]|nr:nuclear cap-binding protein subunit 2 [Nematocida sp. AWRm77]